MKKENKKQKIKLKDIPTHDLTDRELLETIKSQNEKLLKKLRWMAVANYVRLAIIIIPLILAFIYLPVIFEKFWEQYIEILPNTSNLQDILNSYIK
jgi:hypothetical protein